MNKLIFIFICVLFSIFAYADVYRACDAININVPCLNDGIYCSSSAQCNASIFYPNSSLLVEDQEMTNNIDYYNYSLLDTCSEGSYNVIVRCGDINTSVYATYSYEFTKNGLPNPNNFDFSFSVLIIIVVLGLLIFMLDKEHFFLKLINSFFIIIFAILIPMSYVVPTMANTFYRTYMNYIWIFVAYVLTYFFYWMIMKFKSFRVSQ